MGQSRGRYRLGIPRHRLQVRQAKTVFRVRV